METETSSAPAEVRFLRAEKYGWQLWTILLLGLILVGAGLGLYGLLREALAVSPERDLADFLPPILYGLVSFLILVCFLVAQKEALIRGLRQELIQQKIEAELNRELALLDPVTEVYNRRYLRTILAKEMSRVKRYGAALTVMLVDIVDFHKINESLGHAGGDVVLRQIAHLVKTQVRNSDTVVRFGGDDFLLVLPDTEEGGVPILATRLKEGLVEWSRRSGMTEFHLRLAIGVASCTADRSVDTALEMAEQRMQQDLRGAEAADRARRPRPAAAEAGE